MNIQDGVSAIGGNAFSYCGSIKSISIPGSVTEIGESSFFCCTSLTTVSIAEGVKIIHQSAFSHCALKDVTIPSSVTEIGQRAFGYEELWTSIGPATVKTEGFVVRGSQGTAVEKYAKENEFTFEAIGALPSVSNAEVSLSQSSYTYDGNAKKPSVTVKLNGKTLKLNTDYTVSYSNNVKPGTASVTVTGKGSYAGSIVKTFTIKDKQGITCKKKSYDVVYGAKPFKINASSADKLTFSSSDKKVAEVNKSTGKVTVKGCGVTTITVKAGTKSVKVTVTVKPKKQAVKSAKAKSKKLTIKWKKDKKATGYEVQISTDKKFKKIAGKQKITKNTKDSYTSAKLKARTYYVRVRSYKKSGKKQIPGAWSQLKTVRVR